MKVKAYAKLNLNLHIFPKRKQDGFFPIKFINCQLSLHDCLIVKKQPHIIEIVCNNDELKDYKDNLVYKAAVLLKKQANNPKLGVKIFLEKNIPVRVGLGGGSSDAAITINTLIKIWKLNLTEKQRSKIIDQLGKDVYYCCQGGVCEVNDSGEMITRIFSQMKKLWLIIIVPQEKKPATAWMYKNLDLDLIGKKKIYFDNLKRAIIKKNKKSIIKNLHNDFESLALLKYPYLKKIKDDLIKQGASNTIMAGAGLSIVGFFLSKKESLTAFRQLKVIYKNILWSHTKS